MEIIEEIINKTTSIYIGNNEYIHSLRTGDVVKISRLVNCYVAVGIL